MANYIYNEHDVNQVLTMRKKLKKKKQKRRRIAMLIILLSLLFLGFIFSPASKVKKVTVKGCSLVDEESLIDNLSVKVNQDYFFKVSNSKLKKEVEKHIFVKNASIKKDIIGNITITIEENNAILYTYLDNILYIVDEDGIYEEDINQKLLSYVQRYPQAINFNKDNFKLLVKQYHKLPSVIKNQISSIIFEPDEKDQDKCKLEMDDGKIFYVRMDKMAEQLTSTNYYLVIQKYPNNKYYDFLGKNVYVYN